LKDDWVYLKHIAEAIDDIENYTSAGFDVFMQDRMQQDAVIRKLEIIGEATKQLSAGLRNAKPNVPWREIAGMRDKMIHEYFGVNLEMVWGVVEQNLPQLKKAIRMLLEK
jgi:uncharacterized protein with HEPN domain